MCAEASSRRAVRSGVTAEQESWWTGVVLEGWPAFRMEREGYEEMGGKEPQFMSQNPNLSTDSGQGQAHEGRLCGAGSLSHRPWLLGAPLPGHGVVRALGAGKTLGAQPRAWKQGRGPTSPEEAELGGAPLSPGGSVGPKKIAHGGPDSLAPGHTPFPSIPRTLLQCWTC